jgi:hypothetical protein
MAAGAAAGTTDGSQPQEYRASALCGLAVTFLEDLHADS